MQEVYYISSIKTIMETIAIKPKFYPYQVECLVSAGLKVYQIDQLAEIVTNLTQSQIRQFITNFCPTFEKEIKLNPQRAMELSIQQSFDNINSSIAIKKPQIIDPNSLRELRTQKFYRLD
jgi:methylaspartate ammonia-lyase